MTESTRDYIVVDRVNAGVGHLVADDGAKYEVPLAWLPPNLQAGDTLVLWGGWGSVRFALVRGAPQGAPELAAGPEYHGSAGT